MNIYDLSKGLKKNAVKFSIKIPYLTSTVRRLLSEAILASYLILG